MRFKLIVQAVVKFITGLLLVAVLLFVPAGTLKYMNGWLLIIILFVPMLVAGVILLIRNPALLEKRLKSRENESEQKYVIVLSAVMFISAFILSGLNFRFKWLVMPNWVTWIAAAIFLLTYILYAEVIRENQYLSRTVEVQEGQEVVDTGLYGIVRHPMYSATVLLFLSMPLVLGSPISFIIMLAYIPIIGKRIRNEEKVLEEGLRGYKEYKDRVKYKVIPFIW